jgi:signal peptide peptidase SppA
MQKRFATEIHGRPWMMHPAALGAMCEIIASASPSLPAETQRSAARGLRWLHGGTRVMAASQSSRQQKSVAVLGLYGVTDKRESWILDLMGGTSTDRFGMAFDDAMNDPNVKGVVIDTDSPGGSAIGTYELSKRICDARDKKPIVAVSNSEMNSAAYYIASAAHAIVATPSSSTGSIGVWSAAMEYSKALEQDGMKVHVWRSSGSPNKAPFLPWQEFSQTAIEEEQQEVDRIYGEFLASVARNRGVTVANAQKSFGEGRTFHAKAAIEAGMVDRIGSLEDVAARMLSGHITLATLGNRSELAQAFDRTLSPDESWRDANATERLRLSLRRKGLLSRNLGVVEGDPPNGDGEAIAGEWRKPELSDFTDEKWSDLNDAEREKISKYFGWFSDLDDFENLKLPHHFPPMRETRRASRVLMRFGMRSPGWTI